jgi:hypothetical protein
MSSEHLLGVVRLIHYKCFVFSITNNSYSKDFRHFSKVFNLISLPKDILKPFNTFKSLCSYKNVIYIDKNKDSFLRMPK